MSDMSTTYKDVKNINDIYQQIHSIYLYYFSFKYKAVLAFCLNGCLFCSEFRPRRMTRGFKVQAEQQSLISVDAAMRILEQKNQPLIVDHNKLKVSQLFL